MAKQVDGECDSCGEYRKLTQAWVSGVETWACAQCSGEDPDAYDDEPPEPCTAKANAGGCTCRMSPVNTTTIDPPEPIIDGWCPLHGRRDPDQERDQREEDRFIQDWADSRHFTEWKDD
jgi:hypothetical protein